MAKLLKVYLFNWNAGGYNTVRGTSKRDAIAEIKAGKQWRSDETFQNCCGGVNWSTLRRPKDGELEALDKHYQGMFD